MVPSKNTAYKFSVALVSRALRPQFQVNPTLAVGDVKVSIDEGAFTNLTTLPSIAPAGNSQVLVSLSKEEMNGERIAVSFKDVVGAEWDDLSAYIDTTAATITQGSINAVVDSAPPTHTTYTFTDGTVRKDYK